MSKVSVNTSPGFELNQVARGIAILAVVFLHTLSAFFPENLYQQGTIGLFLLAVNQSSRFCVPLFLALSSYGLDQKYQDTPLQLFQYITSRFKKIVPSYLLWSSILIIFGSGLASFWRTGISSLLPTFIFGQADYHFYFIPLLIQFYLLFPLFLKLKRDKHLSILLILGALYQLFFFSFIRFMAFQDSPLNSRLQDDQAQYRLLTNWVFYFLLGIYISRFNKRIRKIRFLKYTIIFLTIFGLVFSIADSHLLISTGKGVVYSTSFIRPPVLVYSTAIIALVLVYGQNLLGHVGFLRPYLFKIGQYSYTIYLSHTLFLRLLVKLFKS